ncbi:Retrovirus-related Pol polyprotein from transposon TNT 1-94 [Dendrobium catenatum]|uniref:Retrovirus-related Pol polyprotein from transposon TNT 1-94 n=1 Tax=Dendrobium catenatum TaxID=906689 RepID=A0A2I0VVJ7_9ASPA|nr:Retrovirus-related Pol polyprotein from transposon TNT 1-94 [Dendrobium catenatum]
MRDSTMTQYLAQVKTIVDNIAAAGSRIESEDIIMYILNGLPAPYNPFKSSIRTSQLPISLETLYSLLCSEEINLQNELRRDAQPSSENMAFYSNQTARGRQNRGRGSFSNGKGRGTGSRQQSNAVRSQTTTSNARPTCQICAKNGHTAVNCWYHYSAPPAEPSRALFTQPTQNNSTAEWILDSGATSHLTADSETLQQPTAYAGSDTISIANGNTLPIQHQGQGLLPLPNTPRKLYLQNILHVPALSHNLLSIHKLTTDNNCSISFDPHGYTIQDLTDHQILLRGRTRNGLYSIFTPKIKTSPTALKCITESRSSPWHARLSHPHHHVLQVLAKLVPSICIPSSSFLCRSCNVGKSHKLPFVSSTTTTYTPFSVVHTDVWGPSPVASINGHRYFVTFIDTYSRFCWIYLMHSKDQTFSKFTHFNNLINNMFKTTIKILRSDGGGEFNNHIFTNYLSSHGIIHQLTCPYTPEQNGLAERKNRHLLDIARTLLHNANLPNFFWAEAILTANYLINRLPTKAAYLQIPYQLLHGKLPHYDHLRTFGCLCYPWLQPLTTNKLQRRSQDCLFLGYSPSQKGYQCYNLKTHKIHVSRHVVFYENQFPYMTPPSTSTASNENTSTSPFLLVPTSTIFPSSTEQNPSSLPTPVNNSSPINPLNSPTASSHSSTSIPTSSSISSPHPPVHQMQTLSKTGHLKPKVIFDLSAVTSPSSTPTSYTAASKFPHWRAAMSKEFLALQQQSTWSLTPPPTHGPVLGCKWLFKTKLLPHGQVSTHKARLVAQGFAQEYGINYTETFSPVSKMPTVCILLTIALTRAWPILHFDISNAFLHGDLTDTVYMKQPPGFVDEQFPHYVCKLHKFLYGLKQAPRQWFDKLTTSLKTFGFTISKSDPSLLIYTREHISLYLLIYVDDLLLTGNDSSTVQLLIHKLKTNFSLKELGSISTFLGIQVQHTPHGLFLQQSRYAENLLQLSGFTDCRPVSTPSTQKTPAIQDADQPFPDPTLYCKLAGSLMYLTVTRPDIAFATNHICQYMHQPSNQHFLLLK